MEIKLLYVEIDRCKSLAVVNHPTQGKLLGSANSLARESRGLIYLQRKHSPEMSGCLPSHPGLTTNMAERHEVWQASLMSSFFSEAAGTCPRALVPLSHSLSEALSSFCRPPKPASTRFLNFSLSVVRRS